MPWRETDVREERIKFVMGVVNGGKSLSALCREFGISRRTGYRWLERYEEAGSVLKMEERSRRPHHIPLRTGKSIEDRVIRLRKRYGWGGKKLRALLLKEGIRLPVITIDRIIKRSGLVSEEKSCQRALKRFERARPNELWQMDFKGEFRSKEGICIPLTILDDHSRFVVGIHALERTKAEVVERHVVSTFREFGVPDSMLMDHGSPWWATIGETGLTSFSVSLIRQGIKLIYSGVRHPQTQGKIERFHRTLKDSVSRKGQPNSLTGWKKLLTRFRYEYNNVRPHEALEMNVPASRYSSSAKKYNPNPPPWDYPSEANVRRINSAGNLNYRGNQFFVSKALAGDYVSFEEMDEVIMVRYRNMYVREIEPSIGRSTAVLLPMEGY